MIRYFLVVLIAFLFLSCKGLNNGTKQDSTDSTLLSTSLISNPNTINGMDTALMNNKPTMDFKDTVHDFGKIIQGVTAEYEFEFTNNGKTPLIISSAIGSCGCTIADYDHEPILAGKKAKLKAIFNSNGKFGHQEKSIAVTTNSRRGTHALYLKADVEVPKEKK